LPDTKVERVDACNFSEKVVMGMELVLNLCLKFAKKIRSLNDIMGGK
jgi:hypothetical protein